MPSSSPAPGMGGSAAERPTVVTGQPCTVDPTRAPDGQAILWVQLQEVPYAPTGDAAGEIDVGGGWTPELAGAYADRVLARIAEHAPNLPGAVLGRTILAPPDLEARNVNLHRGDPYGGSTHLDQALAVAAAGRLGSHRTPVDALWHIGASTHPGPGLNAASGRIVASRLIAGEHAAGTARWGGCAAGASDRRRARAASRLPSSARTAARIEKSEPPWPGVAQPLKTARERAPPPAPRRGPPRTGRTRPMSLHMRSTAKCVTERSASTVRGIHSRRIAAAAAPGGHRVDDRGRRPRRTAARAQGPPRRRSR